MTKTKITIWLEKGKPTRVKTARADEFYLDDLSKVFEEINRMERGEGDVAKQKKNSRSPNG